MLMNKINDSYMSHVYQQAPEVMEQDHGYDFKAGKLTTSNNKLIKSLLYMQFHFMQRENRELI